jgi:ATP-dependent exoDNAse (exonuclease V) beta subunit
MPSSLYRPIPVNEEQEAIVAHVRAHRLTVASAGAGAGKTYTTVAGIIELLGRKEASTDQFILITFTNKAADHLRHALHKALSEQIRHAQAEPAKRMYWLEQRERLSSAYIGTIHGFCRQVLTLYGYGAGVSREASVSFARYVRNQVIEKAVEDWLQQKADLSLAEQVRSGTYPEYKMRKLLGRMLEGVRNQGMNAQQLLARTVEQPRGGGREGRIELARLLAEVDRHYREACREAQQLDSAALLEKTLELLQSNAGGRVAQSLAGRFRFLFIDEFQDTTDTQAAIVDVLARDMTVLVVGDKKQSIYGFTGAEASLLEEFAKRHKTSCLPLKRSGRPTLPLLQAQNALFKKMREHFPELDDPLEASGRNHSPKDGLAPIEVILAPDHQASAVAVATQRIGTLLGTTMDRPTSDGGPRLVRPADIAVLVRTNAEVGQWVKHLEEAGIPARSDTGISYLSQPEIVGMYRFLQLLSRYPDDVALVEALSTPHFEGIDVRSEEKRLLAYGFERGKPLTDEYERSHAPHARIVRELLHQSRIVTVPQLLGLVEQAFQLKHRYREQGFESAAVNLDRLRDYARNRFNSDQALTLRTFLDMLQRDIMNDTETRDAPEQETEGDGQVTVMTVHRSKGLEFPIVIVPGIAEDRLKNTIPEFVPHKTYGLELNVKDLGVFPSAALKNEWRAMQQHLLAEEMRLFYVAVTRAEHMVCMFGVQLPPDDKRSSARSWQAEVLAAQVEMEQCGAEFRSDDSADASEPGWTNESEASAGSVESSGATSGPEPVARVS